jgi:uncharacterized protein DUF4331
MRNIKACLVGAAAAVVCTAAAVAGGVMVVGHVLVSVGELGSTHREAPRIMLDQSADNTDVYAFVAPDASGKVTAVANSIPLENPAGGPYFGKLDPQARYYVRIDNTSDGVDGLAYRWSLVDRARHAGSLGQASVTSATNQGLGMSFVGPRDEPFFVDLGVGSTAHDEFEEALAPGCCRGVHRAVDARVDFAA